MVPLFRTPVLATLVSLKMKDIFFQSVSRASQIQREKNESVCECVCVRERERELDTERFTDLGKLSFPKVVRF